MALAESRRGDFEKTLYHLQQELASVRTGRANPAMVESISVDAYGTPTPLQQLASVTTPEPTQLLIQPWDPNVVKSVEKALQASALGIMPTVEGTVIRLHFPPLTEDRRKELVRVVREKLEMAKVAVRGVREDMHKQLKQAERDGSLSEDQAALELKTLQTVVEEFNERITALGTAKEQEVTTL
jgi:ribosome recycling factor